MADPACGRARGRDGGRPVTGGVRGSARAAARRAPQGAKAELPDQSRRVSRGRLRPPHPVCRPPLRPPGRATSRSDAPGDARRARRALEAVKKVVTTSDNFRCRGPDEAIPAGQGANASPDDRHTADNGCSRVSADALHPASSRMLSQAT